MTPPKIYLQWHGDGLPEAGSVDHADVTWCADRMNDSDVEYVRADIHPQIVAGFPNTNAMIVEMKQSAWTQLAQALSDKSLAQEQSEQDTRRRLEAEEEAAYFRQMNERLIAQLEQRDTYLQKVNKLLVAQVSQRDVMIEQLKAGPQWIPVTERLPEMGDLVVVYHPNIVRHIVEVLRPDLIPYIATHWQSVPPAPTG